MRPRTMGLICGTAMLPLVFFGFPWFVPGLVVLVGVVLDRGIDTTGAQK